MQKMSRQETNSSEQIPECQICGMTSRNLITHITRTHKISCSEYASQYPGSKIFLVRKKEKKLSQRQQHVIELKSLGTSPLTCRLCGFESYMSLTSHITKIHKFSMAEYRKKFPEDVIQRGCPTTNEKNRIAQKERLKNPDLREKWDKQRFLPPTMKEFWIKKGLSETDAEIKAREMRDRISKIPVSASTRSKLSEKSRGIKNPMSIESIAARHHVTPDEASAFTPCYRRSGSLHPMYGKHHTEESLQKIANADHLKRPKWSSKGEKELANFCNSLGVTYENVKIGRYNVDVLFAEKKLIVEYFGDLWHMSPRRFEKDQYHYLTRKTACQVWERDHKKMENFVSIGYKILVIWESDWKNDRVSCEEKITDAYNQAR